MLHDLRYAVRLLRRSPGFAISAVLALALGIGANTAVFSVIDDVLLKPLPYPDPERLVRLYERNVSQGIDRSEVSPGTFVDWRARSRTLEDAALFTFNQTLWAFGDQYDMVAFSGVSPGLFTVLRVSPILGRTFRPEADRPRSSGDADEVVISYGLWQRRFGGDPSVLGRRVLVEGRFPLQIIGVMPRGFAFPDGVDAWGDLRFGSSVSATQRQRRYYDGIARLSPGATLRDARTELAALSAQIELEQPRSNAGWTAQVEPLADETTRSLRPALLALLGAVGGVLLIGCANVANLLLARATARRREFMVRAALGAGTARLLRQCLTEALTLAACGTAAGVVLGSWMVRALVRLAPSDVSRLAGARMNGALLLFAAAVGLITTVLIALAPALQVARAQHDVGLRPQARAATDRAARARRVLIAAEVAAVVLLLTGALLLVRTFVKLRGADLGFQTERVLTVETRWPTGRFVPPGRLRRPWFQLQQHVDAMVAAIRSVPGVDAAGVIGRIPLAGEAASGSLWLTNAAGASGPKPPASARDQWKAEIAVVTPGYFEAMGIALIRGRRFTDADRFTEPELTDPQVPRPAGVAIVNSAFASRYFGAEDPIGRAVFVYDDQTFSSSRAIVGIVADVRSRAVSEPAVPAIFLPHGEHPDVFRPTLVIRSALPPDALTASVRARLRVFDPALLLLRARPMGEVVAGALSRPRFNLLLIASFAAVGLALASIGIYGVVALLVTERTREIGIRIALGARPANVLRLVVSEGMAPVALGAACGVLGACVATRGLQSMLYGVTPLDPVSLVAAPALLALVAVVACVVPARRATRVDPVVALREE